MQTRYHIGAKQLKSDIESYAKRFDLLEVHLPAASEATRGPSPATLRRWRKATPPRFEFVVVAGPHVGRVKASAELDAEVQSALETADVLQARLILVRTPIDVTPSPLWRERLAQLFERMTRTATQVAWEPSGVWEVETAAAAAKRWGAVLVVDPSRDPVPVGPVVYGRIRALGETRSVGVATLERVVESIGERRDAYVVLETPTALTECKRLRHLSQTHGSSKRKAVGGGRILKPRGVLEVRDDEQDE